MGTAIDHVDGLGQKKLEDIVLEQKSCVVTADGVSKWAGYRHLENS